jgi:hypothetical protein
VAALAVVDRDESRLGGWWGHARCGGFGQRLDPLVLAPAWPKEQLHSHHAILGVEVETTTARSYFQLRQLCKLKTHWVKVHSPWIASAAPAPHQSGSSVRQAPTPHCPRAAQLVANESNPKLVYIVRDHGRSCSCPGFRITPAGRMIDFRRLLCSTRGTR